MKNTFQVIGPMAIGTTSSGYKFLVDTEDLEKVRKYTWTRNNGYLVAWDSTQSKNIYLHRLIMNVHEEAVNHQSNVVHHRDHNITDNRKKNLQLVSTQTNLRDCKLSKRNTSGITGVTWNSGKNRWQATIRVDRKLIMLGVRKELDAAIELRKQAELQYFQ